VSAPSSTVMNGTLWTPRWLNASAASSASARGSRCKPRRRGARNSAAPTGQSVENREAALARAKVLRPVLIELAGMSARAAALELNKRQIETPAGGRWHAQTVSRIRKRLQHVG